MEKSVKNYSGRERLVPALLLVIGLICASWLTIRTERQTTTEKLSSKEISDTVIKKNEKSARFSRKTITRYDENGEPHQEVIEEFKGDEELRDVMSIQGVWRIPPVHPTDPIPPIDLVIPIPPNVFGPDPLTNFNFMLDTIPGKGFRWRSESQWKDFSEEFEKNFKERFGDFYRTHEKDFEKMMREMEEKFHNRFNEDHFDLLRDFDLSRAVHEKEVLAQIEELKKMSVEEIGEAEEQAKHAMEEALQHMEWQNEHQHQLKQMEQEMQKHSEQFKLMEDKMRDMEVRMKSFEKELKEELVKDGYIGSRDKIKNIQWDDDGQIEVNGKKIKEADKEKYQKLHRKYFKEGGNFRHVE